MDYQQSFKASYQLPLDKLPVFDWLKSDASYTATYSWLRGTELDDGTTMGNTISNNRNLIVNGALNMETLYNHIPFLKKTNERFKKQPTPKKKKTAATKKTPQKKGDEAAKKDDAKEQKQLPKNKNTFQKELTLLPDSAIEVQHGKKSKRLLISARDQNGRMVQVKWKTVDENKIKVWITKSKEERAKKNDADAVADSLLAGTDSTQKEKPKSSSQASAQKIKLSITPKEPLDNLWWYNAAQYVARGLMMVRTVNLTYHNQASMTLPGFLPSVGDAFGQRTGSVLSPGLDFAFGLADDGYLQKALDNDWLLRNESVVTPFTSSKTEELQLKATLEPVRDLKIDLNASRTMTQAKSVQFMYSGNPTTLSGSFNMTTISLRSALEGIGDANNGYQSRSFDEFCGKVEQFRERVQAQYEGAVSPGATGINQVDPYSGDVLIPAFLSTYTAGAGSSLDIFPVISRILPNWTIRYAGLSKLPWMRDHFKSVNLNHSYKSVYSVGTYNSYSSWLEYMGDLGFVQATNGTLTPSSRYNVPTVSINEQFSPLLGIDVTLLNNMTVKLEYKTTRVLTLSTTSVQINEALSKDWVIGLGYKISNVNLFSSSKSRKVKGGKGNKNQQEDNKNTKQSTTRGGVNHDLNLRADLSLRDQAAITRDIATGFSSASSGNSALKFSFAADYTLSRMLTLSAYYNRQTNTPLLSSSSYPTTTRDFGLSMKFSLTR